MKKKWNVLVTTRIKWCGNVWFVYNRKLVIVSASAKIKILNILDPNMENMWERSVWFYCRVYFFFKIYWGKITREPNCSICWLCLSIFAPRRRQKVIKPPFFLTIFHRWHKRLPQVSSTENRVDNVFLKFCYCLGLSRE